MVEIKENRIVKGSTGSGALTLVAASLVSCLSGPIEAYAFEQNENSIDKVYQFKSLYDDNFDSNVERIVQYTSDTYKEPSQSLNQKYYEKSDLKFLELSQELSDKQVDIDVEILLALNEFGKSLGNNPPRKNRF